MWKECEGQYVDNRFPLRQFLNSTRHSAVFLTEIGEPRAQKAVIKFISADIPAPDEQLAVWNEATHLDHPNILRVLGSGRTQIAGLDILYIVMEYAAEDLSRLLTKRALTATEVQDLLKSLLQPLTYLHRKGLAHGHIKPSNLLACDDRLELSSDTIFPSGYSRKAHRDMDIYDAPEHTGAPAVMATLPADVWSVGITLVEALTQQAPALPYDDSAELTLPTSIPAPFLEIARGCLLRTPAERWTIEEIATKLGPSPLAATAGITTNSSQKIGIRGSGSAAPPEEHMPGVDRGLEATRSSPTAGEIVASIGDETAAPTANSITSRPEASTVPLPRRKASTEARTLPELPPLPPLHAVKSQMQNRRTMPGYLLPVVLLSLLVVAVLFAAPRFMRHVSEVDSPASGNGVPAAGANSVEQNAADQQKPVTEEKPQNSAPPVPEPKSESPGAVPAEAPAIAASVPETTPASDGVTASPGEGDGVPPLAKSTSGSTDGQVLDQVLPKASSKALATIHGTVRVGVRVRVDAAGNVVSAELNPPGASRYFSELALEAAKRWQFSSPVSGGRSMPSQWDIRFEFTPKGATAGSVERLH
ncbi:MAG: TonB family protein [Candidatus Acidiferrum sp.]